jgi:chromosome segregation ATPase
MQEDFESDLSETQKDEKRAIEEFAQLKEAKQSELAAGQAQYDQLQQDDAEFREKNAQAYEEMNDTMDQVAIDTEFLRNLEKTCATADEDYTARTKGRLAEMEAVADTIAYLNSDAAFDMFDKTVNTAFLQLSSKSAVDKRRRAAEVLRRTGNSELAMLASKVQLDAFEKVKEAIDQMVVELKRQQQDEVEHRDWCTAEMNTNTRETAKLYDKKASLETLMADTEKSINELTADIEQKTEEIATMQSDMKKASEVREGENADFQQQITDQVITQAILRKACDRMKQVYSEYKVSLEQEDQPGAAHTQTSGTKTDPGNAPAKFKKYDQNAAGDKVIAMIESVIKDSKDSENELRRDEENSQGAYESNMKDLNKAITDYTRAIVNNKENKAKAEQTLTSAKEDFSATMKELEGLDAVLGSLHQQCDFLLKNFDARQQARTQEMEALNEAKAILAGMQ